MRGVEIKEPSDKKKKTDQCVWVAEVCAPPVKPTRVGLCVEISRK